MALVPTAGTKTYQNAVTTKDVAVTLPGGTDGLVVTLNFGGNVTGISCTWDQGGTNQSMAQLVFRGGGQASVIFGLRAPVVGAKTLRVSWTTTSEVFIAPVWFSGMEQSSDAAAFPHTGAGSNAATVTVTSAAGNTVVACESSGVGQGTSTGTLIYDDHVSGAIINAMAQYDAGAASVAIGNNGTNTMIVGLDVAAATVPSGQLLRQRQMDGGLALDGLMAGGLM